jgi:hypothetical protein
VPPGKIDITDFKGLVTAPGMLARSPMSALQCDNWQIPAPGLLEKRRGFQRLASGNAGGPIWKMFSSMQLQDKVLCHIGTAASATQFRVGNGTAPLTALPAVDALSLTRANDVRSQMALCEKNHYVTTDQGVGRIESGLANVRFAGMPRGLGLRGTGTGPAAGDISGLGAGSASPLAVGFARAYRVTWHRKDADGVELGSAPTGRTVISNAAQTSGYTGGVRAAIATFAVPFEFGTTSTAITTDYYWRLWGTTTYDEANGQFGNDEMFLIAERFVTGGQIAAGYVSFADDTPDSFLPGAPTLNTNQYNFPSTENGLLQGVANESAPPPPSNDVAYWQDCMWYGDVTPRASFTIQLLANLADADTFTVFVNGAGITYTGRTVAVGLGAQEFRICTTAATTALNIRETVANLVAAINRFNTSSAAGINAYHVSTTGTNPGVIFFEARRAGDNITMTVATGVKWAGMNGYVVGSVISPTRYQNQLWWSKPTRADAVPPINVFTVGPVDAALLRVVPFRDRLLLFTTHGIWQVTGRSYADFSVVPFDFGYRLLARDLVVACDQKIYAWCYEGIIEVDDGGVSIVSLPIGPTITELLIEMGFAAGDFATPLYTAQASQMQQCSFAAAYRSRNVVRFFYTQYADASANMGASKWLEFNTQTRTWTTGSFSKVINGYIDSRNAAVVRMQDDVMFMGSWSLGADTYPFRERLTFSATDYEDDNRDGGGGTPITSTLQLQFLAPDDSGSMHWQQFVINWNNDGQNAWVTLPTAVAIRAYDENTTSADVSPSILLPVTRLETPAQRRAQRISMQLVHAQKEYCGIVGLAQHYRQGARFVKGAAD